MIALALLACTGTDEGAEEPFVLEERPFSDCDPISYDYCALPFPSSYYLRADSTTETGWRVNLGATTLPRTDNLDLQPDPWAWNELDGFSPLGPILAHFPNLSVANLPSQDTIDLSISEESPILVLDVETGEHAPFFAEL